MKNFLIWPPIFLTVLLIAVWLWKSHQPQNPIISPPVKIAETKLPVLVPPLDRAQERVTKKKFGGYFNDRFRGFHTGADFEIFPEELDKEVQVHAVCAGKLRLKEFASGYGGIAVQDCQINNHAVTIIYGHLKLTSIAKTAGQEIKAGEVLGILGAAFSQETDGERKHLHLGFHQGEVVDIRGYVNSPTELSAWLDPCQFVCQN